MVLGTSGATLSLLEDGLARERLVSAMAAVFWRSASQNCCVGQFFGLGRIVVLLRRVVSSGQPFAAKDPSRQWRFVGAISSLAQDHGRLVVQICTKVLGSVEVVCFSRDDCDLTARCWT